MSSLTELRSDGLAVSFRSIDLTVDQRYRPWSFDQAPCDWPVAIRATIGLVDTLLRSEELPQTLLPRDIRINEEGTVEVVGASINDGAPFAAPELVAGEPISEQSLVFTVAAIHYHLISGRPPIGDVWRLKYEFPELPSGLQDVILQALDADKTQRVSNLKVLRQALYRVLVPRVWWEKLIPKLPITEAYKDNLLDMGYKLRARWIRFRDQLPWQQYGRIKVFARNYFFRSNIQVAIMLLGMFFYIFILISLLSD